MSKDVWFRNRLIRDAIYHAIYDRMKIDDSIYIMGEGSHMKVHFDAPNIERNFPDRIITLPISEDANTNFALGMTLAGTKPIVDVITADFLYRTMDSICNTIAKTNFVSEPKTIVIRSEFMTAGPTTGQRPESLFTHIPGLNVVIPSNPLDAHGLMDTVLTTKAATLFFEDRMIEDKTTFPEDMDTHLDIIPLSKAKIRKKGYIITIVSYALTLRMLDILLQRENLDYELIDLRSIYPVDYGLIAESVRKTGRLLIVEPDVAYAGVGAEITSQISEKCFNYLAHPVTRLGAPRITIPSSRSLHDFMLPSEKRILEVAKELSK